MKPKLWDGPSPVGEAKARFNETLDTPYQTASGPGFSARKMNGFSEVTLTHEGKTVEEPVLFSAGYAGDNFKRRATDSLRSSFHSTIVNPHTPAGHGYSYGAGFAPLPGHPSTSTSDVIDYQDWSVAGATEITRHQTVYWLEANTYLYLYKRAFITGYSFSMRDFATGDITTNSLVYSVTALGKTSPTDDAGVIDLYTDVTGEVDAYNIPLCGIFGFRVKNNFSTIEPFEMPRPPDSDGKNMILGNIFTITPSKLIAFVGVMPTCRTVFGDAGDTIYYGIKLHGDGSRDIGLAAFSEEQGAVYVYISNDSGSTWAINRFTPLDYRVPVSPDWANQSIPDLPPDQTYLGERNYYVTYPASAPGNVLATAPGFYNMHGLRITEFCSYTKLAVFSPNTFVIFCAVSDNRTYSGTFVQARTLVFRTTDGGANWTNIPTPISSLLSVHTGTRAYDYDIIGLRQDCAFVRAAIGFSGIDRPVTFLLSTDRGATWTERAGTGLPSLMNQYVGFPECVRVFEEDGTMHSEIVVNVWNAEDSAYVMYSSTDDGNTWEKKRTVAHADYFRRVDIDTLNNPSNDVMPNFGVIDYRGTIARPVPLDVAMPWRYDSTITPPA